MCSRRWGEPTGGAQDRRRVPGGGGVRGGRRRGPGTGNGAAVAVRAALYRARARMPRALLLGPAGTRELSLGLGDRLLIGSKPDRLHPQLPRDLAVELDVVDEQCAARRHAQTLEGDLVDLGARACGRRRKPSRPQRRTARRPGAWPATAVPTRGRCWCRSRACSRASGDRACTRSWVRWGVSARSSVRRSRVAPPACPAGGSAPGPAPAGTRARSSGRSPARYSGLAPSRFQMAAIARPRCSSEIPEESWKATNESSSGEVRTPPKSDMTASIIAVWRARRHRDLHAPARASERGRPGRRVAPLNG